MPSRLAADVPATSVVRASVFQTVLDFLAGLLEVGFALVSLRIYRRC
jgi:hypothetical protein